MTRLESLDDWERHFGIPSPVMDEGQRATRADHDNGHHDGARDRSCQRCTWLAWMGWKWPEPKRPMPCVPDELGRDSDKTIVAALGSLSSASIASLSIDWNANLCTVEVYVCDRQGQPIVGADSTLVTTFIEFPVRR